jgi:hypothetical protein
MYVYLAAAISCLVVVGLAPHRCTMLLLSFCGMFMLMLMCMFLQVSHHPSWNKCLHELDWYFPSKIIDSSVPTPAPVFEMMSTNTSKCSYFKSGPGLWTLLAATYNRNHIYIYCWCWVLLVIF